MTAAVAPHPPVLARLLLRTGIGLMLALWVVAMLAVHWTRWPGDLAALYVAGHLWHTGQTELIFAAPERFFGGSPPAWEPVLARIGAPPGEASFPYIYPPLWAALVAPLTAILSPMAFFRLVLALQLAALAAALPLAWRVIRPPRLSLPAFLALSLAVLTFTLPGFSALMLNQPTLSVTVLILVMLDRLAADRPVAAGLALALAIAIKLSPAAFLLVLLLDRQGRALATALAALALIAAVSLAWLGLGPHAAFRDATAGLADIGLVTVMNVSARTGLYLLAHPGETVGIPGQPRILDLPPAIGTAAAGLALAALAATALATRRLPPDLRRPVATLAVALVIALFGPLGWLHYYLLPALLLPVLGRLLPKPLAAAIWAAVFAGTSLAITLALPRYDLAVFGLQLAIWSLVLAVALAAAARQNGRTTLPE